jgi:hypothetical protein
MIVRPATCRPVADRPAATAPAAPTRHPSTQIGVSYGCGGLLPAKLAVGQVVLRHVRGSIAQLHLLTVVRLEVQEPEDGGDFESAQRGQLSRDQFQCLASTLYGCGDQLSAPWCQGHCVVLGVADQTRRGQPRQHTVEWPTWQSVSGGQICFRYRSALRYGQEDPQISRVDALLSSY